MKKGFPMREAEAFTFLTDSSQEHNYSLSLS